MTKKFFVTGSIFGLIAVILGAFGAHGLKPLLTNDQLASFETGVRYQFYHALFFLVLAIANKFFTIKQFKTIYRLVLWGVILFSGSIYLLTIKNITGIEALKFAGAITPIGGALIIGGWSLLLYYSIKLTNLNDQ